MADDPKKEEVCDFVCHQQEQAAVADGRVRLLPPCAPRRDFCSLDVPAATTVLTVNAMLCRSYPVRGGRGGDGSGQKRVNTKDMTSRID